MNLLEQIESLCRDNEQNAAETLSKIREIIENESKMDFSKIKDGEHFVYNDIEFIKLGEEQNGILCIAANPYEVCPFDANNNNDWRKSSARKKLNTDFLKLLNEKDLLTYTSDLTADNGDDMYGKCEDKIGLLSCDLYRKYRKFIPLYDDYMWTCTPWYCRSSGNAYFVRLVYSDGTVINVNAINSYGLVPACIFAPSNIIKIRSVRSETGGTI